MPVPASRHKPRVPPPSGGEIFSLELRALQELEESATAPVAAHAMARLQTLLARLPGPTPPQQTPDKTAAGIASTMTL
jgi:hypothetical protein